MNWKDRERKYLTAYLAPLVGATVVGAGVCENDPDDEYDDGENWPYIMFRLADGTLLQCEISRDPEGNGPGFIFGLPRPEVTS